MKRLIAAFLLAVVVLPLMFAGTALAAGLYDDKIIFGDDFTLRDGEVIHGDLVVMGGDVLVEEGATVTGTVVVFGGNLTLAGRVEGDVVTFGGDASLDGTAVVEGQLVTPGGSISRAEGAVVQGGETEGFDWQPRWVERTPPDPFGPFAPLFGFIGGLVQVGLIAVLAGVLAFLVAAFLPEHTLRVSGAITTAPALSAAMGLLTSIAVPVLIVVTAITICLLPISLIGALLLSVAWVFGWLALGSLVGAKTAAALRLDAISPALAAGLGTFGLTVLASLMNIIEPVVGGPLALALGCVLGLLPLVFGILGLGAVILTRFGTRAYVTTLPAPPAGQAA